jgi:hypothetical protein
MRSAALALALATLLAPSFAHADVARPPKCGCEAPGRTSRLGAFAALAVAAGAAVAIHRRRRG